MRMMAEAGSAENPSLDAELEDGRYNKVSQCHWQYHEVSPAWRCFDWRCHDSVGSKGSINRYPGKLG